MLHKIHTILCSTESLLSKNSNHCDQELPYLLKELPPRDISLFINSFIIFLHLYNQGESIMRTINNKLYSIAKKLCFYLVVHSENAIFAMS